MNGEDAMKIGLGFLFGAVVGAVVALLFAPSSGEELRANIKTQADSQAAKLQEEWQKGMQEMKDRMDKMGKDLQAMGSERPESLKNT